MRISKQLSFIFDTTKKDDFYHQHFQSHLLLELSILRAQLFSQRARKLKKVQTKNSWNQINREITFWALFPSPKVDFWPFLKLQKIEFGQKKFSWNWFIWFHKFFLAWTFLIFLARYGNMRLMLDENSFFI